MANKPSLLSTLPTNPPAQFLKDITDGFSKTQMLGEGAFGTVYKVPFSTVEYYAISTHRLECLRGQVDRAFCKMGSQLR